MTVTCFQYWDKGIDMMPPMIKFIYDNNLKQSKKFTFNLVVITDENVKNYFNPHPRFFELASNFKSDIVRYNVLDKNGGIWLDTDIVILRDLNVLYNKLLSSKYDAIVDTEYAKRLGSASLVMKQNSLSSNFCLRYLNNYLSSYKPLNWGEIGPLIIEKLAVTHPNHVKINDAETVANGCNFISWRDDPGFNKSKWYMNPIHAMNLANKLLSNNECYYVITWTIYRKNDIKDDIVKFVFRNPKSVFTHLIK